MRLLVWVGARLYMCMFLLSYVCAFERLYVCTPANFLHVMLARTYNCKYIVCLHVCMFVSLHFFICTCVCLIVCIYVFSSNTRCNVN